MVKLLTGSRGREIEVFEENIKRVLKIWIEIENEFPLFSAEDVKMVIHNSIGFVNLDRCAEIAMRLGDERSLKFTVIADLAVRCKSFRNLRRDSLNKVLIRTLRYLTDAGLLINTWAGKKGR